MCLILISVTTLRKATKQFNPLEAVPDSGPTVTSLTRLNNVLMKDVNDAFNLLARLADTKIPNLSRHEQERHPSSEHSDNGCL